MSESSIATQKSSRGKPVCVPQHGVDSVSSERDTWGSNASFVLAAIGAAIGLGAVIRYPFLAFEHGGIAFLIPYVISLFVLGFPLLGLEFFIGQNARYELIGAAAKVHPRAFGIGVVAPIASFSILLTYNVIMSWCWVMLFYSFYPELPWGTTLASTAAFFTETVQGQDPAQACQVSLECGIGLPHWPLVLGLAIQYTLVFLACFKGVELVSKVVWFTVLAPIVMLIMLVIYGGTLPGAVDGIVEYVGRFDPAELGSTQAWVDAAGQIFYGLSLAVGVMVAYSSNQPRNAKQRNNVYFVAVSNALFSFISGFAIFSVAGYLAFESGTEVRDLPVGGFSLSFVTFPAALALMPPGVSHFFSIIFFLFLILLGFDSSMALVEGVVASICDHVDFFSHRRGLATGLVCFVLFCFGLICTTPGGDAIMDIIDHFNSTYLVLLIGLAQCILFGFVYEFTPVPTHYAMLEDEQEHARKPTWQRVLLSTRLEREIERACGQSPKWLPFYWSAFIKFVCPVIIVILFALGVQKDAQSSYGGYPDWANLIFGWLQCVALPWTAAAVLAFFPYSLSGPSASAVDMAIKPTKTRDTDARSQESDEIMV